MRDFDASKLQEILSRKKKICISDIKIIGCEERLYSTIWYLGITTNNIRELFVAKNAGSRASRQTRISNDADRIFRNKENVFSTESMYVEEMDLVVSRKFSGSTLEHSLVWRGRQSPFLWHANLRKSFAQAGEWLRRFHDATRGPSGSGTPLLEYLENRSETLDSLPSLMRQKLVRLVSEPLTGDFVVTHGDFTPANILFDNDDVCVIDFGIKEWIEMSPWWDLASTLVYLQRYVRFQHRSPLYWVPRFASPLERMFRHSYGNVDSSCQDYLKCLAIRHFSFLSDTPKGGISDDGRPNWHFNELDKALTGR